MIIPQMQQRYTGYSSEGSGNLLNAVMRRRQQDLNYKARMKEAEARDKQFEYAISRDKKADEDLEKSRKANQQLAMALTTRKKTEENYEKYKRNEDSYKDSQTNLNNVSFMNLLENATLPGMISGLGKSMAHKLGFIDDPYPDRLDLSEWAYNNIVKSDEDFRDEFSKKTGGAPPIYEPQYNPYVNDPALKEQYFNQIRGSGYTFGNQPTITIK